MGGRPGRRGGVPNEGSSECRFDVQHSQPREVKEFLPKDNSNTRRHILSAVVTMLDNRSSGDIRVAEVALRASVSVKTIYYYFESLTQLIAQAQVATYVRVVEPLHQSLAIAEIAVSESDEVTFWKAIGDNVLLAWSNGQGGDGWRISRLLVDISSDIETQREFSRQVDVQFERWISVIEAAKERGWIKLKLNSEALIAVCWASTNGQSIFSLSSMMNCSPESARDFFLQASKSTDSSGAE
jgi:AcrR family transcriptional regulator